MDALHMFNKCTEIVGKTHGYTPNPITWEDIETCKKSPLAAQAVYMITKADFDNADTNKNSQMEFTEWIKWLNKQKK